MAMNSNSLIILDYDIVNLKITEKQVVLLVTNLMIRCPTVSLVVVPVRHNMSDQLEKGFNSLKHKVTVKFLSKKHISHLPHVKSDLSLPDDCSKYFDVGSFVKFLDPNKPFALCFRIEQIPGHIQ